MSSEFEVQPIQRYFYFKTTRIIIMQADKAKDFFIRIDDQLLQLWKGVLDYNVLSPQIANGDCSAMYMAEDKATGKKVAMKTMSLTWMQDHKNILDSEVEAINKLSPTGITPTLLRIPFRTRTNVYMPLELCNCGSLDYYVHYKGPFSEDLIRDIVEGVATHLKNMHEMNILHRNLKASHILVHMDDRGAVTYKLMGFQFFKDLSKDKAVSSIWSPGYNAPETTGEHEYGFPADIWSFGIIIYFLATGCIPVELDDQFVSKLRLGQPLVFPAELSLSKELIDLITKCLCYKPEGRLTAAKILEHPFTLGQTLAVEDITNKVKPIAEPLTTALGEMHIDNEPVTLEEKKVVPPVQKLSSREQLELIKTDFYKYFKYVVESEGKQEILKVEKKDKLDPYVPLEKLEFSHGGFSEIYLCCHKETKQKLARKVINVSKITEPQIAHLMIGEIEIMLTLKESPFTIELVDYFIYENTLNMILEYCNGGDLDSYVRTLAYNKKILPLEELKLIAWNVACGLNDMHMRKMMHRDIKPKNVLVIKDKDGDDGKLIDVKLCDYGLGKKVDFQSSFTGSTVLGTFEYFAPELYQLMEKLVSGEEITVRYNEKIDVWSYGVLLYFTAYGKTPMEPPGSRYNVIKKKQIIYHSAPGIPESFLDLIRNCLIFDSKHRPSFGEILKHPFFSIVTITKRPRLYPYSVGKLIGESAKGTTKVHEVKKGKQVFALKSMHMEIADKKYLEGEVDTLLKLKNCKNVVRLHDYFLCNNIFYLVMDYYPGGNLEKFVFEKGKKRQNLSVDQQVFVAYEVLRAIKDIHAHNIIHRDINPKNIVITTDPGRITIKSLALCDFGFAKVLLAGSEAHTIIGTYKSPELILPEYQGKHDNSTDIWSFGMLLYFILFGVHLTSLLGSKSIDFYRKGIFPFDEKRLEGASNELFTIMVKCLQPNPKDRPKAEDLLKHETFKIFNNQFSHYLHLVKYQILIQTGQLHHIKCENKPVINIRKSMMKDQV
eukprot:TRINITY_DN73_c0_g2_i1.p1 TRINITY_DN73_c0_g2~~TRINITY_DN73_c0_g2_i1.p1  ORF type:complete len:999 (+),score=71.87 TRINITY_DN73_c0_g2_i1:2564-5560(+)